jgi:hypothetical protein
MLAYDGQRQVCKRIRIGKNTIATYPRLVAEFFGLEKAQSYTSHPLRRTAATWLADAGIDLINLKRFGDWASDTVTQQYIAESSANKHMLTGKVVSDQSPAKVPRLVKISTSPSRSLLPRSYRYLYKTTNIVPSMLSYRSKADLRSTPIFVFRPAGDKDRFFVSLP